MTYLLAGGCGFSDYNFKLDHKPAIDTSYPKWPTILAKRLNISKIINTAKAGGSNELVFGAVFDNIVISKPKVVTILMTAWDRTTPYGYPSNPFEVAHLLIQKAYPSKNESMDDIEALWKYSKDGWPLSHYIIKHHMTVKEIVNNNLRMLYSLQEMCKQLSINLLVAQAFDPIKYSAITKLGRIAVNPLDPRISLGWLYFPKVVSDSVYFDKIEWDKITIGGPFFEEIGGRHMTDMLNSQSDPKLRDQLWIPNDNHPSAKGHEAIAQIFYEEYKKRYV